MKTDNIQLRSTLRATVLLAIAVTLALPLYAGAQEQTQEQAEERTVIKMLRHARVNDVTPVLAMLGVRYTADAERNQLVLQAPAAKIDVALEVLENLDIPPKPRQSVKVDISILQAFRDQGEAEEVAPWLTPVVAQLREVFGYQSVRILDGAVLTVASETHGALEGGLVLNEDAGPQSWGLRFSPIIREGQDGRRVEIDDLSFAVYEYDPDRENRNWKLAGLQTAVDLREGQTAVIGKATPTGTEGALVLVMRVEIVE